MLGVHHAPRAAAAMGFVIPTATQCVRLAASRSMVRTAAAALVSAMRVARATAARQQATVAAMKLRVVMGARLVLAHAGAKALRQSSTRHPHRLRATSTTGVQQKHLVAMVESVAVDQNLALMAASHWHLFTVLARVIIFIVERTPAERHAQPAAVVMGTATQMAMLSATRTARQLMASIAAAEQVSTMLCAQLITAVRRTAIVATCWPGAAVAASSTMGHAGLAHPQLCHRVHLPMPRLRLPSRRVHLPMAHLHLPSRRVRRQQDRRLHCLWRVRRLNRQSPLMTLLRAQHTRPSYKPGRPTFSTRRRLHHQHHFHPCTPMQA